MSIGPNQKKWLDALRSGEYEQGTGALCDNNKYCCLGVGCEVLEVPKVLDRGFASYDGEEATAPPAVVVGLSLLNDRGASFEGGDSLVRLNDEVGKTLVEIADIVESNPTAYFKDAR